MKHSFIITLRSIIAACLLCLMHHSLHAQTRLQIRFPEGFKIPKGITEDSPIADSATAVKLLGKALAVLYDAGYLGAELATIHPEHDTLFAEIIPGFSYQWMSLRYNGPSMPVSSGLRPAMYEGKPVSLKGIKSVNSRLLSWFENNGYPFAVIRYRDFRFEDASVSATLNIEQGEKVIWDSLRISGNCRLSSKYLENYLSIKPGDLYNESDVRAIAERLKELPMAAEVRPYSISFTVGKARPNLYLNDKKASQIDGVIGVQPPATSGGKTRVTADLRMRLMSSFGRGELFDLNWKQPAPLTQDLKVKFNYPFIFETALGADLGLAIYKKDSTYIDVNLSCGVQYLLSGGNYFKAFVEKRQSTLITSKAFENSTVLPPFADVSKTLYGLGFKKQKLDYRLNPRKGYRMETSLSAGNRVIEKDSRLKPEIYDSLDLKTLQLNGDLNFDYFIPIYGKLVCLAGLKSGWIAGDGFFENEMLRLGGNASLRGFDEESIRATAYAIGNLELRYLLDLNSNVFVFYNHAWYEMNGKSNYISDKPRGFGAGISFDSKLGIFTISYALGKEFDNPMLLRSAKIHFGVVNYF